MKSDFTLLPANLDEDPSRVALELEHLGLLAAAFAYCTRNGTDGFVPDKAIRGFGASGKGPKLVAGLVQSGDVERVEGGYRVVAFLRCNPSAADVEAKRAAGRARKAAYDARHASGHGASNASGNALPASLPPALQDASVTHDVTLLEEKRGEERRTEDVPPLPPAGGRPRRKVRIPETWEPSAQTIEKFQAEGLDATRNVEEFRDYWLGRGDPKADWDATFRGWIRRLATDGKVPRYVAPKAKSPPAEPFAPPPEGFAEALANLKNPNEKLIADILGAEEHVA